MSSLLRYFCYLLLPQTAISSSLSPFFVLALVSLPHVVFLSPSSSIPVLGSNCIFLSSDLFCEPHDKRKGKRRQRRKKSKESWFIGREFWEAFLRVTFVKQNREREERRNVEHEEHNLRWMQQQRHLDWTLCYEFGKCRSETSKNITENEMAKLTCVKNFRFFFFVFFSKQKL